MYVTHLITPDLNPGRYQQLDPYSHFLLLLTCISSSNSCFFLLSSISSFCCSGVKSKMKEHWKIHHYDTNEKKTNTTTGSPLILWPLYFHTQYCILLLWQKWYFYRCRNKLWMANTLFNGNCTYTHTQLHCFAIDTNENIAQTRESLEYFFRCLSFVET